jgi:N-acetylmuramoyl-L-alanine amidase
MSLGTLQTQVGDPGPETTWKCEVYNFKPSRFRSQISKLIFLLPGLIALALAGCQQPQKRPPRPMVVGHTLTIEDLALRLGLRVEEKGVGFVVLKNAANTVLLFTQTNGRFFVNGKSIGSVGEITRQDDGIYVSDNLVPRIRQYLRPVLAPPPRPQAVPPKARGLVAIDPGHGGHDPGAMSSGGTREKNINLEVALRIADLLQRNGVGVVMTRQDDQFIELEERADIANRRNADLFVSIHSDSNPDRGRQGFTVYVAKGASAATDRAAGAINQALAATGTESHGIHEAVYKVLINTSGPAVLIELGYLSNYQDVLRLRDPAYQDRLAQAIAAGILNYLR